MLAIIALIIAVIVGLTIASFAVHILFSPWILLAVAVLLLIKFRPRRSHQ